LLLHQQEGFFAALERYHVRLHFPRTDPKLIWQMFTRDTGFVIHDHLYYSAKRLFHERIGEAERLLQLMESIQLEAVTELKQGSMEGGDVVVTSTSTYVGNGSRTEEATIRELSTFEQCSKLFLGNNVMHLDTRFTILSPTCALIEPSAFEPSALEQLKKQYTLIPVLKEELLDLGTNVFMVNPQTVFSAKHNTRINTELKRAGFHVEALDYTEPISLGGSFRCTTLPLVRG
jgi:N-dimethylarginine dimethylaminohydrolase